MSNMEEGFLRPDQIGPVKNKFLSIEHSTNGVVKIS